ncbi:MAG: hypothetical protein EOO44_10810 [Flavobacterium sp.]|nr:MAG: hypothetical protein EOO44_10810 [Flavobacterium sp.]
MRILDNEKAEIFGPVLSITVFGDSGVFVAAVSVFGAVSVLLTTAVVSVFETTFSELGIWDFSVVISTIE